MKQSPGTARPCTNVGRNRREANKQAPRTKRLYKLTGVTLQASFFFFFNLFTLLLYPPWICHGCTGLASLFFFLCVGRNLSRFCQKLPFGPAEPEKAPFPCTVQILTPCVLRAHALTVRHRYGALLERGEQKIRRAGGPSQG